METDRFVSFPRVVFYPGDECRHTAFQLITSPGAVVMQVDCQTTYFGPIFFAKVLDPVPRGRLHI